MGTLGLRTRPGLTRSCPFYVSFPLSVDLDHDHELERMEPRWLASANPES